MKNEMKALGFLVRRNIKLYFKDKLIFFISLITPLILTFLFFTFLKGVYEDSLISSLPEGMQLSKRIVNAFTGGWLFSSILATSCITVAFCSNMVIDDKIKNIVPGLQVTPVKKSTMHTAYVVSNFLTTMLVCLVLFAISLIYMSILGWYLSFVDLLLILANITLTVLLGTIIMSIISLFISSQGAYSAICTLVSSMYGFICGAYMPINSMGSGMRYFASFLPGTYSTIIFRKTYMNGVLKAMGKENVPAEVISSLRQGFDGEFKFFNNIVPTWVMFLVLILSVALLFTMFILLARHNKGHKKTKLAKKV